MAEPKKPLEPLIPMDELKKVVRGLIHVPKDELDKAEADRLKRPRQKHEKDA